MAVRRASGARYRMSLFEINEIRDLGHSQYGLWMSLRLCKLPYPMNSDIVLTLCARDHVVCLPKEGMRLRSACGDSKLLVEMRIR